MTILLGIIIGISVAFGVYTYHKTLKLLYWIESLFSPSYNFVRKYVNFVRTYIRAAYNHYIKEREYVRWKKYKLPKLKLLTRQGDRVALAERIKRSNHIRRWSGDNLKPYEE